MQAAINYQLVGKTNQMMGMHVVCVIAYDLCRLNKTKTQCRKKPKQLTTFLKKTKINMKTR